MYSVYVDVFHSASGCEVPKGPIVYARIVYIRIVYIVYSGIECIRFPAIGKLESVKVLVIDRGTYLPAHPLLNVSDWCHLSLLFQPERTSRCTMGCSTGNTL